VTDRSPKYGLTEETLKPVTIACNDLSQAINALDRHHAEEGDAFEGNLAAATATLVGHSESEGARAANPIGAIETAATRLRTRRQAALAPMLAMREQLVDVLLEAHSVLPGDAVMSAHVEPGAMQEPPRPISGVRLDPGSSLRLLSQTYAWTRDEDVPPVVELGDGDPVSELSQAGEAATSGAAVVMGL
jgi:hypothetical protein